jgi:hypothetical protein
MCEDVEIKFNVYATSHVKALAWHLLGTRYCVYCIRQCVGGEKRGRSRVVPIKRNLFDFATCF